MTIELFKVPSELFDDVDSNITGMANKLNEVIIAVNKAALLRDGNLAGDLHILLQAWKKEAEGLRDHPGDYGVSRDVCFAVSHRLFQCYAEVLETIS